MLTVLLRGIIDIKAYCLIGCYLNLA